MSALRNRSGKLPLIAIIAVVLVLVLAVGAFAFLKMGKHDKKKVELSKWKINDLLVTLGDTDELRYLKINITLEVESKGGAKKSAHGQGEMEDPEQDKALDVINSVCAGKKLEQLLNEEGKNKLKEELKTKLNEALEESEVHEIFFTYFALQ